MDSLLRDLRYALRTLRARPGFALAAALTLALGVGSTTTIFSAVNALLLRPLPIADVDRLVYGMSLREGFDPFGTSLLEYGLFQKRAHMLSSLGLAAARTFNLVGRDEPERLLASAVSVGYLRTLGVRPVLGRLFEPGEDRPEGPAVALVAHALWQRRFAGDPGVLGRALNLEGRVYSVVGVLPPGFDLPYSAQVWVPLQVAVDGLPLDQRATSAYELVARLRPGVSVADADRELKQLAKGLEQEYPQVRRGWSYGLVPLRRELLGDLDGRSERSLAALLVGVGFLLLICCANAASLLLARGVAREAEIAVRRSLGAGESRLVRQLLSESLVLALLGGGVGVLAALEIQPLLRALNPIQAVGLSSLLTDFRVDVRVLLFSLCVSLATGLIAGVAPAVRGARLPNLASVLKRREQRGGVASGGSRLLDGLVVAEIAIAATLLVGGGLMAQSLVRLQTLDLGFRPQALLSAELPLSPSRYGDHAQQAAFIEQTLERVRALPGVAAAGITTNVPLQRGVSLDSVFEVEGRARRHPGDVPITAHRLVSPGYLETLGVTLLAGRLIDERDRADSLPVAVVSEELVRQAWPGESALGRRVRRVRAGVPGPWMSVVGVVRDVKEDRFGFRIARPVWYLPFVQQPAPLPVSLPLNLVVRASGEPKAVSASLRSALRASFPEQPLANLMPMTEYLGDVLLGERFGAVLMATLAGLGLLTASIGLYGVIAYSVGQRTGELGLRLALGARPADIGRLVLGEGARRAAAGLALGLLGAFGLARLLAHGLYGVRPDDPATFVGVGVVLGGVALAACALPAARAARVDPMQALRNE